MYILQYYYNMYQIITCLRYSVHPSKFLGCNNKTVISMSSDSSVRRVQCYINYSTKNKERRFSFIFFFVFYLAADKSPPRQPVFRHSRSKRFWMTSVIKTRRRHHRYLAPTNLVNLVQIIMIIKTIIIRKRKIHRAVNCTGKAGLGRIRTGDDENRIKMNSRLWTCWHEFHPWNIRTH